jgi:hypothetical protein
LKVAFMKSTIALLFFSLFSLEAHARVITDRTATLTNLVTTDTSVEYALSEADTLSVQVVADVNTPAAKAFAEADVDTDANTIAEAAHGYTTGLKGQFTTTDTLPAGLELTTDYFVIATTAGTYKVASSLANALAGTAVDITDDGTGTHTFTPTAIAGGSVKLQKSNDKTNWVDEGSATNITADATIVLEKDKPTTKWGRLYITLTAGSVSAEATIVTKGATK